MWSTYSASGGAIRFVRVGTLEHTDLLPPDIHILGASKQAWVVLPQEATMVPSYATMRPIGCRRAWSG